jgi:hypothetical protein
MTVGLSLGAIVGLVGCGESIDATEGSHELAIESQNGLSGINGLNGVNGYYGANGLSGVNGLNGVNGLSGVNGLNGVNGLSAVNGLNGVNGLAETSGLMTTDAGRKTVSYLVKCALSNGDTLVKKDQNSVSYTFNGGLGLCPAWKYGSIHNQQSRTCQNLVSACLMAHINTAGVHVPLWLDSAAPQIGWGRSPSYPYQEGTFFGSIIETGDLTGIGMAGVTGPTAYFCEGTNFNDSVVAGRIGKDSTKWPYKNAFASSPYGHTCDANYNKPGMTVTPYWSSGMVDSSGKVKPADGFQAIMAPGSSYVYQTGEPITVWRNSVSSPTFDQVYQYSLVPDSGQSMAMDDDGSGNVVQNTIGSTGPKTSQQFGIAASPNGPGKWVIKKKDDKMQCICPDNGPGPGNKMKIKPCDNTPDQDWSITQDANSSTFLIKPAANTALCLDIPSGNIGAPGAPLDVAACDGGPHQKFRSLPGY